MNKLIQAIFLLIFLLLPLYSLEIVASLSLNEIINIFLFLVMTISILISKKYNMSLVVLVFILAFLSFCFLNFTQLAYMRDTDLFFYITSMINIFLSISIVFFFNNNLTIFNKIMVSLYSSSLFLASFGITQFVFSNFLNSDILLFQSYGGDRITGFFSNPNTFAFFMHFGFFYSYFLLKKDFKAKKLIALTIFILAIYLSGSFGAFISIMLVIIINIFLKVNWPKRIVLVLTSILTIIVLWNAENINKFLAGDDGLVSRLQIWSFALENFKSNIIYGVGFGNFQESLNSSYMSHNLYLQILIETGIVGTTIFFLIIGIPIFISIINMDFNNQILVSALLSTLIHSFFINSFNNPMLWILIALTISYTNLILKGRRNNEKKDFSLSRHAYSRRL